jgi:hypothetical protein
MLREKALLPDCAAADIEHLHAAMPRVALAIVHVPAPPDVLFFLDSPQAHDLVPTGLHARIGRSPPYLAESPSITCCSAAGTTRHGAHLPRTAADQPADAGEQRSIRYCRQARAIGKAVLALSDGKTFCSRLKVSRTAPALIRAVATWSPSRPMQASGRGHRR